MTGAASRTSRRRARGTSRSPITNRQRETRVHHPTFTIDRRLGHVRGAREVHCHVASLCGQVKSRQITAASYESGPHQRTMRTGDHPQLARCCIGTRHRDTDGHAAALIAVPSEAAILVPRHVTDAFDNADRLDERLDAVVGSLLTEHMTITWDLSEGAVATIVQQARRRVRVLVEPLHTNQPVGSVGRTSPPRPTVGRVVRRRRGVHVRGHLRHLCLGEQTRNVQEAGRFEEPPHRLGVVVGTERRREVDR